MDSRVTYVSLVTSCPCPGLESAAGLSVLTPLSTLIIAAIPSLVLPNINVFLRFVGKGEGAEQEALQRIPGITLLNNSLTAVPWGEPLAELLRPWTHGNWPGHLLSLRGPLPSPQISSNFTVRGTAPPFPLLSSYSAQQLTSLGLVEWSIGPICSHRGSATAACMAFGMVLILSQLQFLNMRQG